MNHNFWRYFWAPIVWAAVLFLLSSIPDFDPPIHISRIQDKYGHVIVYLPLGFLLLNSLQRALPKHPIKILVAWTFLIGTVYGISDEIHQYFVPGRFMDWLDIVADFVGIALGCLIYLKLPKPLKHKLEFFRI